MREANAEEIKHVEKFTGGKAVHLGVYLVAPDGTPLGTIDTISTSADKIFPILKEAAAKFGPIEPRKPPAAAVNPDRGVGLRGDGSARMALTVRYLDKSFSAGQPVFDSIVFTKEHWVAIAPPAGAKDKYEVPDATARQFARAVSASSDLSYLIRPQDLHEVTLTGEVVSEKDGYVQVRLAGKMAGKRPHVNEPTKPHEGSLTMEGMLVLDARGRPVS